VILTLLTSTVYSQDKEKLEKLRQELESKGVEKFIQDIKKSVVKDPMPEKLWLHASVKVLGDLKDPRLVVPIIENFLKDQSMHVRVISAAVAALETIGDIRAVEPLIESLKGEKSSDVKRYVAWALGGIKDSRAVEPLIDSLQDEQVSTAAHALVLIGSPKAVEAVISTLKNNQVDSGSRGRAARALRYTKDPKAMEALINALINDKSSDVRQIVVWTLNSKIHQKEDPKAVEALINALINDKSSYVRRDVADVLGKIKDPKVVESLIITSKEDINLSVREKSLSALFEIGDPKAIEVYISFLSSKDSVMRVKSASILLNLDNSKAEELRDQVLKVLKEESFIELYTSYDKYGRAKSVGLSNIEGEKIAEKSRYFHDFNNELIRKEVISDSKTSETLLIIDYNNYGKPINPMRLCLDIKGNIMKKNGKPIIVKPFEAQQESHSNISYRGLSQHISSVTIKIYRCKNCEEMTGIKGCLFIW